MGWNRINSMNIIWNRLWSGRIKRPTKYLDSAKFESHLNQKLQPGRMSSGTTRFSDNLINRILNRKPSPKKVSYKLFSRYFQFF